jgi:hypothetical protein
MEGAERRTGGGGAGLDMMGSAKRERVSCRFLMSAAVSRADSVFLN